MAGALCKAKKREKAAAKLEELGLETYCPVLKTKRKWSDRWKWVEQPLFSSYVFVHLSEKERSRVFEVPLVLRYLYWQKKPAVVRVAEIEALQRWLGAYAHEAISVSPFKPNQKVKIESGALMEREATVKEVRGQKLVLVLEGLGAEVVVDLSKTQVKAEESGLSLQ